MKNKDFSTNTIQHRQYNDMWQSWSTRTSPQQNGEVNNLRLDNGAITEGVIVHPLAFTV